jgi:hypothetical protein
MEMLLDFRQRKFQKKYQDLSEKLAPKNSWEKVVEQFYVYIFALLINQTPKKLWKQN